MDNNENELGNSPLSPNEDSNGNPVEPNKISLDKESASQQIPPYTQGSNPQQAGPPPNYYTGNQQYNYQNNPYSNNPYYQNNQYSQQYNQQQKPNGLAIASLVLGILSIPTLCCYFGGIILGIIGLILGIASKKPGEKISGFAIGGIVCSGISILIGVFFIIIFAISITQMGGIESILDDVYNYSY